MQTLATSNNPYYGMMRPLATKLLRVFFYKRVSADDKVESLNIPEELCLCMGSEINLPLIWPQSKLNRNECCGLISPQTGF